jgi:mono/diheme cytochrome c family protein
MIQKKYFSTTVAFTFVAIFIIACSSVSTKAEVEINTSEIEPKDGKDLYKKNCNLCHGSDGARGMSGAANLATSVMSREAKIEIITNGKGAMSAYGEKLTTIEIASIADYLDQLKK